MEKKKTQLVNNRKRVKVDAKVNLPSQEYLMIHCDTP